MSDNSNTSVRRVMEDANPDIMKSTMRASPISAATDEDDQQPGFDRVFA
jgi:hypothetical protein